MHSLKKLALVAIAIAPFAAQATSGILGDFNTRYGTSRTVLDTCTLCHPNGTSSFNAYANALISANRSFAAIENVDSDGDGATNITEIEALTFPGDRTSVPAPAAAPRIAVSPLSLALGTVTVGSSASQTTTVSNSGTADLTVTASRCGGTSTEFAASPASFTVAAGGRTTVTVAYTPSAAGTDSGCIALANNDAATGTVNVQVNGTGQAATPPPPATTDLDITRFTAARKLDLSRGGTAAPTVNVVATVGGTATVAVEGVGPAGVVYSASQEVTLATGATAKVKLPTFTPTATGSFTFTATIADAATDTDSASVTFSVVP